MLSNTAWTITEVHDLDGDVLYALKVDGGRASMTSDGLTVTHDDCAWFVPMHRISQVCYDNESIYARNERLEREKASQE